MLRRATSLRGRVESFRLDSDVLRENPLRDPHRREVAVYLPPEYDREPRRRFPVFVDLVGFFGTGRAHTGWKAFEENVPLRIERLVREKRMGPVIAVFPDCWTRLGGNQYINSSAVGRYADYLLHEILPEIDDRYRSFGTPRRRAVFGKSSGGYGAIVHGMKYARHWGAVASHSGDVGFDLCYRADIPRVCNTLARHGRDVQRFLRAFYAKRKTGMDDSLTLMFVAMAAFYDPDPGAKGGFHLPMDLRTAELDPRRWARWLSHDPLRIVERASAQRQLRSLAGVFIDCGSADQFHLHFGARRLHDRLRELGIAHRYHEFADNHSSVDYRMDQSLPWLYRRIMR